MNRRSFLKRVAAIAAGAVVVPTAVKELSFKPKPFQLWPIQKDMLKQVCVTSTPSGGGVTLKQAMELVRTTLDDMPTGCLERIWEVSC